jgi:hypothetical protein
MSNNENENENDCSSDGGSMQSKRVVNNIRGLTSQ